MAAGAAAGALPLLGAAGAGVGLGAAGAVPPLSAGNSFPVRPARLPAPAVTYQ